jgi:hypothetical protein
MHVSLPYARLLPSTEAGPGASHPAPQFTKGPILAAPYTASFHLIEQPMEATWSRGPSPVRATSTIAS